jgi:tetratricopeptide (TPR) repeat protein
MLFFVPFAILFIRAMNYFSYKKSMQLTIIAFTILIIVGQGHATYIRNDIWKSQESLWFNATAKAFNLSLPHMNLGKCYFDKGFVEKAIIENKLALKVDRYLNTTCRVGPHLNLIACYFKINDFDNVIKHCSLAQAINPNISSIYDDLALALLEKGDLNAAYHNARKSLALNVTNARAYAISGRILLAQRHFESAVSELKKALELDPNMIEAIIDLALTYKQKKDYSESIRHFKMAIIKDPNPQNFEHIYAKLGLLELYSLIGDEKALKKVAFNLIRSVGKERLSNILDNLKINDRSLINVGILLSEIGKSYIKEGEDCLRKINTIE